MVSGIYKIVNIITNKCYVGSTKNFTTRWDRHFKDLKNGSHSSIKLQRSYNKHGKDSFLCEIIEEIPYEKSIIIEREDYWIQKLDSKSNGYNIADASFGDALTHHPNREEIIQKIKNTLNSNISKMTKEDRKAKWGQPGKLNGMYGKTHSQEVKKILSEFNKGNSYRLGKKLTNEDTRKKLSEIASKRIGSKNSFYGKTHSEETKQKLRLASMGKTPSNSKPIIVEGIEYLNRREASEKTGIKETTLWHRCNSKNKKYNDTYFKDNPKQPLTS